jgi:hypothetical protein
MFPRSRNLDCALAGVTNGGGGGGGGPSVPGHSPVPQTRQDQVHACISKVGATYHELVTYQPGRRYWLFQWEELALYGAAALLLGAFCIWWVRRRRIA